MASLIEWNANLLTGVRVIDEDHKKLVDMLNRLNDAMTARKGKEMLAPLLVELVKYTAEHFGREESLMAKHKYADSAAHFAAHKKLIDDVAEFQKKLDAGQAMISVALLKFLRDWLSTHIMQTDKKLGKALVAAGAA